MCGIVGAVGVTLEPAAVFEGLRRLEYRGYDSAGLAIVAQGELVVHRSAAHRTSLAEVGAMLAESEEGTAELVIGHTRWATHGAPSEANAHPHLDCRNEVVVVHNGIIENFRPLRAELEARGHRFRSETDTEVIAHMMEERLERGEEPAAALAETFALLKGHMAIVVGLRSHPEFLLGVRRTSPLVAARSSSAAFLASDAPAMLEIADTFFEVPEEEVVCLGPGSRAFDDLAPLALDWTSQDVELAGYASHYEMEWHQGPIAFADTMSALVDEEGRAVVEWTRMEPAEVATLTKLVVVACGTSYHAGLIGRYLIEHLSRLPVEVDVASEYRYRDPILDARTLVIGISQSGESLETVAAMKEATASGARSLAITNVLGSGLARLSDGVLYTRAGPEISVASTKTHLAQIGALGVLATYLGEAVGRLSVEEAHAARASLVAMAAPIAQTVAREEEFLAAIRPFLDAQRFFLIGRHLLYPVALEGALKMKELSYLPAEAYPAGELKHGPIAMLDESSVVIALVGDGPLHAKVLGNLEEVKARGAKLVVVAADGDTSVDSLADAVLRVPPVEYLWSPLVSVVPLTCIAGALARHRHLDLDKPRNLAKTVTVE